MTVLVQTQKTEDEVKNVKVDFTKQVNESIVFFSLYM